MCALERWARVNLPQPVGAGVERVRRVHSKHETGRDHALLGVHRRGEYALRVRDNEYARVGHLG